MYEKVLELFLVLDGVLCIITGAIWLYKIHSVEAAIACAGIVQGYWLINLVTEDERNSKANKENQDA